MFNNKRTNDMFDKFREMVDDYNEENGIDDKLIKLSETQQKALDLYKKDKNLLIIGSGGCGKSLLTKEMKYDTKKNSGKNIVITATTGIAAYNINGITINSFMGIGTGEQPVEILIKRIMKNMCTRDRIRNTSILIIDEISMMSAEIFDKINTICQFVRKNSTFFGGIQLILTGDFFQLLPVFNRNTTLYPSQDKRLIFESEVFNKMFNEKNKNIVVLTSNYRQIDKDFRDLLLRVRKGIYTESDIVKLNTRMINNFEKTDDNIVHLVSSNKKAQTINSTNLDNIKEKSVTYKSEFYETGNEDLCKEMKKDLEGQFVQKGIMTVNLKIGARVMLIKNISVEEGLVNGSVGIVSNFVNIKELGIRSNEKFPLVLFDNGVSKIIDRVEWTLEMNNSEVKANQIPLMLSWAITHHKSQSLTLDKAILDLGDCFCDHQVYVALSRLKSIDGLYLKTFNSKKITINEKVKKYINNLE